MSTKMHLFCAPPTSAAPFLADCGITFQPTAQPQPLWKDQPSQKTNSPLKHPSYSKSTTTSQSEPPTGQTSPTLFPHEKALYNAVKHTSPMAHALFWGAPSSTISGGRLNLNPVTFQLHIVVNATPHSTPRFIRVYVAYPFLYNNKYSAQDIQNKYKDCPTDSLMKRIAAKFTFTGVPAGNYTLSIAPFPIMTTRGGCYHIGLQEVYPASESVIRWWVFALATPVLLVKFNKDVVISHLRFFERGINEGHYTSTTLTGNDFSSENLKKMNKSPMIAMAATIMNDLDANAA
eukprot:Blabericola_migrator_1__9296@NODE_49_length_16431_cov_119_110181_g45_i0_p8_GENE_NODE_49_length_16431_cov_119_110181_g45_i0NODE_49_length_16431_cov_119_110181_g45_i0_p8_ORF_typecomplete_len290_score36_85RITA/PF17066_5/4_5_NODE_49_length_16431_cov_119_110181_g45_i0987910748